MPRDSNATVANQEQEACMLVAACSWKEARDLMM
jgi:hypothetical protein